MHAQASPSSLRTFQTPRKGTKELWNTLDGGCGIGKWVKRMKQPWKATIFHKNKDIDRIFPEHCVIIRDTIEEVLEELLKKEHSSFYEIKSILIKRHHRR